MKYQPVLHVSILVLFALSGSANGFQLLPEGLLKFATSVFGQLQAWIDDISKDLFDSPFCNGQCGEGQGECLKDMDCLPGFTCKNSPKKMTSDTFCTAGPDLQHKYNLTNGGDHCLEKCDGNHGPCDFCGGGLCCRKGQDGNGCDGRIGNPINHTCVLPYRAWECDKFPKWLQKTYHIEGMDFCEQVWNNQHLNSQPLCADNVLPTVDFYEKDGNNTVPLCNLNLNDANEGDLSTLCPILDTALNAKNEEVWIVYIVHGYQGSEAAEVWYSLLTDALNKRHKKNGRKIIVGEVYWEEGAKAHDLQGILDMYSKKGNELENRAYSEPMREALACNRWSNAPSLGTMLGYSKAASHTMVVGNALGQLMKSIYSSTTKENVKSFCIGHSLGSHVCGFTGKVKKLDGILALDPAGPDFEYHNDENRLGNGDAKFVEAIHSDAGECGIVQPVAHVDIYLNGGKSQPHCGNWPTEIGCSHIFPLWFLPKIWKSDARGDKCQATMKCSNTRRGSKAQMISNQIWDDCVQENPVDIGSLVGDPDSETNGVYRLDTTNNNTTTCYFTTNDIKWEEMHDLDKPFIATAKLGHKIANLV